MSYLQDVEYSLNNYNIIISVSYQRNIGIIGIRAESIFGRYKLSAYENGIDCTS